jgi:hypothetical protein
MPSKRTVRRRLVLPALVGVACCVAGAVLSQVGFGGAGRVQIGTGKVSALARGAHASDALPADVVASPFATHNFASPNGAGSRLVKTDGSLEVFAVPGKGGLLCVVDVDELAQTAGGACADRQVLLTGSIYIANRLENGSRRVVGLVGDGHTFAQANGKRTPVENNVFVLPDVEGGTITIGSPTAEQTVDIGD